MPPFSNRLNRVSLLALALCLSIQLSEAGSATWNLNPTSNDWNTAANWTPETVPEETDDIATFASSNVTTVSVSEFIGIGAIVFEPGAGSYVITAEMGVFGAGVINNSGVTQYFDSSGSVGFVGAGTAGADVIYTNNGNRQAGNLNSFVENSNAGSATFIINGALPGEYNGALFFEDHSSAANSTIINNGPRGGENGGQTDFLNSASAGDSHITANPGGLILLDRTSTAANATFNVNGGTLIFEGMSDGGTCHVTLSNGGLVEVKGHGAFPLAVGSLAGDGTVQVFGHQLNIGSNDLDTTFSGVIEEGSPDKNPVVVSKIGTGTLVLSGVNTYTAGTTVTAGTLSVNNTKGSVTGTGAVQVNAGTFSGRSNITGAVIIGSGSGTDAFLAPGINGPGTLVIRNALTFKSDGTYNCDLSLSKSKADQVVCKGVTIESGAQFALNAKGNQTLANGTVFTVLENKTRQHISGTFSNLPDHSTFSANGNTFQVNYEGGDGNDLTLTVAP